MTNNDSSSHNDQQDASLRALAHELKHPLTRIARQAEIADPADFKIIEQTATQALQLIDSYLLHAQTEYGQIALALQPASVGSILYEAANRLRLQAEKQNVSFVIDDRTHDLVMTNRPAIDSILLAFGAMLIGYGSASSHQQLTLRGYRSRSGKMGVGMFGSIKITQAELDNAMQLQGKAHMPLTQLSNSAHVSLTIAQSLCKAIGGALKVKHMGAMSGLATELPRSEQLALV